MRYTWDISRIKSADYRGKSLPKVCHVVLVRVLQKHVSNRIYTYKEIYYEELAPMIVEVKSQDLKTAN